MFSQNLQFYLSDWWALPPLSFCSQSELQSKSEAPSGLSPFSYDGCPSKNNHTGKSLFRLYPKSGLK